MSLARLDNEVFFKKAFTDPFVFRAFVKDIVGIEVDPEKIETEKAFAPKVRNVDFRYDIFAEDVARRVIVEIQKVEYDHNFDRFLHYHLQAITEQQRSSDDYSVGRTVYTIVLMTAPYKTKAKTGEVYRDEVLISSINPKNLQGIERRYFDHEIIFLNPNYKGPETPPNYRDWLDLIYESIHHPDDPSINLANEGVVRATQLINWENISPQEWEASKIEAGKRVVLSLEREAGIAEGIEQGEQKNAIKVARRLLAKGMSAPDISEITGLSDAEILALG
jgi:predicted transposase/invertase (TIGR01784 family)